MIRRYIENIVKKAVLEERNRISQEISKIDWKSERYVTSGHLVPGVKELLEDLSKAVNG